MDITFCEKVVFRVIFFKTNYIFSKDTSRTSSKQFISLQQDFFEAIKIFHSRSFLEFLYCDCVAAVLFRR